MNAGMFSSDSDCWQTPAELFTLLAGLGPILLDPCSGVGSVVPARLAWRPPIDGLLRSWARKGRGFVFVNPPYGDAIAGWIRKCREEAAASRYGLQVVALVPARVDTVWFQECGASSVAFLRGRLTFRGAKSPAPFPSALLYWGRRVETFRGCLRAPGCASVVDWDHGAWQSVGSFLALRRQPAVTR